MLKMSCICDRCGKEFDSKLAQRISFESTLTPEKTWGSSLVEIACRFFPQRPRDYCPECVEEIKKFMENKSENGGSENGTK